MKKKKKHSERSINRPTGGGEKNLRGGEWTKNDPKTIPVNTKSTGRKELPGKVNTKEKGGPKILIQLNQTGETNLQNLIHQHYTVGTRKKEIERFGQKSQRSQRGNGRFRPQGALVQIERGERSKKAARGVQK